MNPGAGDDNALIQQFVEITGCGSHEIAAAAIADADGDVSEAIVRHLSAEAATSTARHSSTASLGAARPPTTQAAATSGRRRPRSPDAPSMLHAPARSQPAAAAAAAAAVQPGGGGHGVSATDIGVFCDFTGSTSADAARDFIARSDGDVGNAVMEYLAAPPPVAASPAAAAESFGSDPSIVDLSGPSAASFADLGSGGSTHAVAPPALHAAAAVSAPAAPWPPVAVASPPHAQPAYHQQQQQHPQQQAAAPDDGEEEDEAVLQVPPLPPPPAAAPAFVLPPFQAHPLSAGSRSMEEALQSSTLVPKPELWPVGIPFAPQQHTSTHQFVMWIPFDQSYVRRLADALGNNAEAGFTVHPATLRQNAVHSIAFRRMCILLSDSHTLNLFGIYRNDCPLCVRFTYVPGLPTAVVEIGVPYVPHPGSRLPSCVLPGIANTVFPSLTPRQLPERHLAPVQVQGLTVRLHQHQRESAGLMAFREQQGLNTFVTLTLPDGAQVAVSGHGAGTFTNSAVADHYLARAAHFRGGVLADEMGLGKTISIIALAALNPMTQAHAHAAREQFGPPSRVPIKTTLVLGTVSIVGQWEAEIKRAMPNAVIRRFYGTGREWATNVWQNLDFAVSTFQTAKNSSRFLSRFIFHRIVVDEYPQSPRTDWIHCMSQRLWFASGTPTRTDHLSVFGGSTVVDYIAKSTIRHTKAEVTNEALQLPPRRSRIDVFDLDPAERVLYDEAERPVVTALRSFGHAAALENAFGQVRNWLCSLRLAATDVRAGNESIQQAPAANFNAAQANQRAEFTLTPTSTLLAVFEQKNLAITTSLRELIEKLLRVPPEFEECCVCMDVMREPCVLSCTHAFCKECIQALSNNNNARPVCPECRADTVAGGKKYHLVRDAPAPAPMQQQPSAAAQSSASAARMTPAQARARLPRTPSRVTYAVKLIRDTLASDPTAKFVIFSSFQSLLDAVEYALVTGPSPLSTIKIVGSVPMVQRARHVAAFQDRASSTKVCLLSSKASAAGLTLTAANHVILLEPATNSSVEAQAAARIHRIGQTRPVTVHRLAARGTVDERLLRMVDTGELTDVGLERFDRVEGSDRRDAVALAAKVILGAAHPAMQA